MPKQGKSPDWDRIENEVCGILRGAAQAGRTMDEENERLALLACLRSLDRVWAEQLGHELVLRHLPVPIAHVIPELEELEPAPVEIDPRELAEEERAGSEGP